MFVWCSLFVSVCMLTMSNALFMSSMFWWFVLVETCCNDVAITERSEMGLYYVPMFISLFGFGIGMMLAIYMSEG